MAGITSDQDEHQGPLHVWYSKGGLDIEAMAGLRGKNKSAGWGRGVLPKSGFPFPGRLTEGERSNWLSSTLIKR